MDGRGRALICGLPMAADAGLIWQMFTHLLLPWRHKTNAGRLPMTSAPKKRARKTRARARKAATRKSLLWLLAVRFLGLCTFLAVFVLDLRNVFQMLSAVLAGEAGPIARVAAWACLLTAVTIVFLAVRRAIAGKRPARRGAKRQPTLIADNWSLIALGAIAVSVTGIAAWTVLLWVANILADGLVLATLAVGALSIGSIVWAIRQPTYPASGKKVGRKRKARSPRPHPKADDAQLRLPPPGATEQTLLQTPGSEVLPAQTTVPSPAALLTPPVATPPEPPGERGS